MKVAAFNVENLFERQRVFNTAKWTEGRPVLQAYADVNALMNERNYTPFRKDRMTDLLRQLEIYFVNEHGAVRERRSRNPEWAWLRRNKGKFHTVPRDGTQSVRIDASGRDAWIGWVELAVEPVDDVGVRMTAQAISTVDADVLAVVEAESRPSLVRFNEELLDELYRHVMLVDGNDERGIDVGLMTKDGFSIESVVSNVDTPDPDTGRHLFSRDCAQYTVRYGDQANDVVHVLVNHFKSQSGGGGAKRLRQATEVARIAQDLIDANQSVIVLGDLNEGPPTAADVPVNLAPLFDNTTSLVDVFGLDGVFDPGPRPGTFGACGIRDRLDYILVSPDLEQHITGGGVFRGGLWGNRKTRPDAWDTFPEITHKGQQASDHGLVWIELDIA